MRKYKYFNALDQEEEAVGIVKAKIDINLIFFFIKKNISMQKILLKVLL